MPQGASLPLTAGTALSRVNCGRIDGVGCAQIGYVVLFAPAFPLAAGLCLLTNIWRLRTDAYLLLYNTQRPPFRCGQDIGTLQGALSVIAKLAVATHVGLLVYTSTQLHELLPFTVLGYEVTEGDKFTLLIILEHALLGMQYLLQQLLDVYLPTTPKSTSIWKAVEHKRGLDVEAAKQRRFECQQARFESSRVEAPSKAVANPAHHDQGTTEML